MLRKNLNLVWGVTFAVSLFSLTACSIQFSAESESNPLPQQLTQTGIDPQLSSFYQQKIAWESCNKADESEEDIDKDTAEKDAEKNSSSEENNSASKSAKHENDETDPKSSDSENTEAEEVSLEADTDSTDYECAQVEVPLDYANPQGEKIQLALRRAKASGEKIGSLFINPGGPGASGQDFLSSAQRLVSESVQKHYDLIGFDPRGVGESAPVSCFSDQELDRERSEYVPMTNRQEAEAALDKIKATMQRCQGKVLPYANTDYSSRDLDILRHVVGDEKLSYLGYSYGSLLGSQYSQNFPERVGRMVLDGILARSYSYAEVVEAQVKGMEGNIKEWVRWCVEEAKSCLYQNEKEGLADLTKLLNTPTEYPTSQAKRPLTLPLIQEAVVGSMYNPAFNNSLLEALISLKKYHRGDGLLALADLFAKRGDDGKYEDNSYSAFIVINSGDYPVNGTEADWDQQAKSLQEKYPLLGKAMGYGEYQLKNWRWQSTFERKPLKVAPSVPIMLIGNLHDPATPYEMAQRVHQELAKSVLVTVDSYAHTAYGDRNSCVKNVVDKYLLTGKNSGDIECD